MIRQEEWNTYHNMKTYGGSFVVALAEAWAVADSVNSARLKEAFAEYFAEYSADRFGHKGVQQKDNG